MPARLSAAAVPRVAMIFSPAATRSLRDGRDVAACRGR